MLGNWVRFVIFWPAVSVALAAPAAGKIDFARDIEPLLKARCQACHGTTAQMNGLRLDRADNALAGGYSGPVIVPGNSARSKLIDMVSGRVEGRIMPPA